MKYRFRQSEKSTPSRLRESTRLRFAGRSTLSYRRALPEPIEQIRLDGDLYHKKRKRRSPRAAILKIYRGIYLGIKALFIKAKELSSKLFSRIKNALAKRALNKRQKTIASLPVLLGAVTACSLVCAVTAGYILLSLFAPYARRYETVTIPLFRGKQLSQIEYPTEDFNLIIQYESNPEIASGQIISQLPAAGVTRRIYGRNGCCDVVLTVSRQEAVYVPDGIAGASLRDAILALSNNGLGYSVTEEYSESVKQGEVIRAYPQSGSEIEKGGNVRLTVSLGAKADTLRVPSLIGLGESEAAIRIRGAGLTLGNVSYVSSKERMGTVISQSIRPDTETKRNTSISLTVSAGEGFSLPTVPDLYGMSVEEAARQLLRVGLTVSSVYSVSSAAPKGVVISQYPLPNTPITSAETSVELHISN